MNDSRAGSPADPEAPSDAAALLARIACLDLPEDLRSTIHHEVLEAGHMPYTCNAAHRQMSLSIRQWLTTRRQAARVD